MPAGFSYSLTPQETDRELYRIDTGYRLSGGFNLEDDKLVAGTYLPTLAPLCVDMLTRKAKAVKCVKVYAASQAADTTIKVEKNSLAYVGMYLGNGAKGTTVSAIDKSNASYDVLTITALTVALAAGDVLFESVAADGLVQKNKANYLNYARTKVEAGATITALGQAFEIIESKLYVPISAQDKSSLGARFMFV